ncbi:MAG: hypothetical protein MZU97_11300 [Bacillus subtilis]|nr:hypothetical protein [Bacillus subtilis]
MPAVEPWDEAIEANYDEFLTLRETVTEGARGSPRREDHRQVLEREGHPLPQGQGRRPARPAPSRPGARLHRLAVLRQEGRLRRLQGRRRLDRRRSGARPSLRALLGRVRDARRGRARPRCAAIVKN